MKASPIRPRRAQVHPHVQHLVPGIDPQGTDEHRPLGAQRDLAQQAVPVGLGLVGCSGGVEDVRPGQAGIAVIREQDQFGPPVDAPRHLEDLGRAQRGRLEGGDLPPVDEQPQAAGPFHVDKGPHVPGKLKIQGSAQSSLALKGEPPGQPGDDGLPGFLSAGIPVANAGLIQRSGDGDVPCKPVNSCPPDARQ